MEKREEPLPIQTRVARSAFAFAAAGGLIAWVVVAYDDFETWGLHFPGRETIAGLLAGSLATIGLRRTVGVFVAAVIGFLAIAFGVPVLLVSLQGASGAETTFETMQGFAFFQAFTFAVLGGGLGLAVDRSILRVGAPVTLSGVLGGVVMAVPFTSLRPRDAAVDPWIVAGLVASCALAGAWTGFVLGRKEGAPSDSGT